MVSTDAFRWRVQVRDNPLSAWTEIVNGMWLRQGGGPGDATAPIDPDRFAAAGADLRSFTKERVIAAPVDRVWAAWATDEGWSDVFPPPSASRIDLAVGGRYEWLFDGAIGGNGSQILSYIPDRMISFSWNAPPSQPDSRLARTWVVVETEALDDEPHPRPAHPPRIRRRPELGRDHGVLRQGLGVRPRDRWRAPSRPSSPHHTHRFRSPWTVVTPVVIWSQALKDLPTVKSILFSNFNFDRRALQGLFGRAP